jgi:hypothetical protein
LEVKQVAPCHYTGDKAIDLYAAEYGENFIQIGVGRVIQFEVAASKYLPVRKLWEKVAGDGL